MKDSASGDFACCKISNENQCNFVWLTCPNVTFNDKIFIGIFFLFNQENVGDG